MLFFATWLVRALLLYLGIGAVFAIAFVRRGAGRVDPIAADGTIGFRLLILPGAVALWPLLLSRWLSGRRQPPTESTAHRRAANEGER